MERFSSSYTDETTSIKVLTLDAVDILLNHFLSRLLKIEHLVVEETIRFSKLYDVLA